MLFYQRTPSEAFLYHFCLAHGWIMIEMLNLTTSFCPQVTISKLNALSVPTICSNKDFLRKCSIANSICGGWGSFYSYFKIFKKHVTPKNYANCQTVLSWTVLPIHDILVWIGIRGSRLMGPDPAIFVIDLQVSNKKLIFKFFC